MDKNSVAYLIVSRFCSKTYELNSEISDFGVDDRKKKKKMFECQNPNSETFRQIVIFPIVIIGGWRLFFY